MTLDGRIECRGRKEICDFLGVRSWVTARKILRRHGLLVYENRRPVLNKLAYERVSLKRHILVEQS